MIVSFRTRQLERCFENLSLAVQRWGPDVGRRYVERVNVLVAANDMDELRGIPPLRFHALIGARDGQYAVRLTRQVRMVLTFEDRGEVTVEEVVDYHG